MNEDPNNQIKEEFEKWARTREMDLTPHPNKKQFPEYDYYDIQTQMFWECWQAALEIRDDHAASRWLSDRFRFAGLGKLGMTFGDPLGRSKDGIMRRLP